MKMSPRITKATFVRDSGGTGGGDSDCGAGGNSRGGCGAGGGGSDCGAGGNGHGGCGAGGGGAGGGGSDCRPGGHGSGVVGGSGSVVAGGINDRGGTTGVSDSADAGGSNGSGNNDFGTEGVFDRDVGASDELPPSVGRLPSGTNAPMQPTATLAARNASTLQ